MSGTGSSDSELQRMGERIDALYAATDDQMSPEAYLRQRFGADEFASILEAIITALIVHSQPSAEFEVFAPGVDPNMPNEDGVPPWPAAKYIIGWADHSKEPVCTVIEYVDDWRGTGGSMGSSEQPSSSRGAFDDPDDLDDPGDGGGGGEPPTAARETSKRYQPSHRGHASSLSARCRHRGGTVGGI
jgi:hypothetical protein